eukprot:CAMPEP_0205815312 /NCGR_PEP_ID=MMETSP0205-20121125/20988_1 /ASSEMBLY_ACC=CAM_ASM_000278 /TAXON_ID=36767 /ORGANISM="Euplotes focardii, Strain TN1" /LENGTH=100 /DNA_ID=CAMNT_0053101309 /DNA_START=104 /DNA_END=403 /DNA_ORIENTATION=-
MTVPNTQLDPNKNYLDDDIVSARLPKKKNSKALHSYRSEAKSKFPSYKDDSDSGVSDINEADFYDSQFERDYTNSKEGAKVTLPKIMGRTPNMPTSPSLA